MSYALALGQWAFNIPPTDSTAVLQGLQCIAAMIGANLSKPHIDHDNVPHRGETIIYLLCGTRVAFVAPMFPRTRLFNQ